MSEKPAFYQDRWRSGKPETVSRLHIEKRNRIPSDIQPIESKLSRKLKVVNRESTIPTDEGPHINAAIDPRYSNLAVPGRPDIYYDIETNSCVSIDSTGTIGVIRFGDQEVDSKDINRIYELADEERLGRNPVSNHLKSPKTPPAVEQRSNIQLNTNQLSAFHQIRTSFMEETGLPAEEVDVIMNRIITDNHLTNLSSWLRSTASHQSPDLSVREDVNRPFKKAIKEYKRKKKGK